MMSMPSKNDLVEYNGVTYEVAKRDMIPGRVHLKGLNEVVTIREIKLVMPARLRNK